ncbi:hypothetical protein AAFC00_003324 [Neodothiora populina]|uniref:Uncharacterized protein n=1 Tax=Neodothiora populina TaxID=2781224 RepID=A0ABR3PAQ6_9PEZI
MSQPIKKTTQTTTPPKPSSVSGTSSSSAAAAAAQSSSDQDLHKVIDKLEAKIKAVNANSLSRTQNARLTSADDKLHPLLSLKTGRAIDRFPETPRGVGKLSVTLVDSTLLALEADRSGKEDEKRARLREQIGLVGKDPA